MARHSTLLQAFSGIMSIVLVSAILVTAFWTRDIAAHVLPSTPTEAVKHSPFGFEVPAQQLIYTEIQTPAQQLGATWVRLNTVSWRTVQPTPQRRYNWAALEQFEAALRAAAEANLTPIVVVDDNPYWATKTYVFDNEPYQTTCGALRTDRFDDFAAFMREMVKRYSQPPYNVQHWEFGNEVDVDPRLVPKDNLFGCWGDIDDPYYGGEHYGEMLQVVTPVVKQVDPEAQILIGGLLLNSPDTKTVGHGTPERFFEGILRSGAADDFDIVAFHGYSWYAGPTTDSDTTGNSWANLGGITVGKAQFLREVMQRYDVDKPLFYNETGFLSPSDTPDASFFSAQADHLVRVLTRAMATDIQAIIWYTLNGPGWHSSALLDQQQQPRPAYDAAQAFIAHTEASLPPAAIPDYGATMEAYRFSQAEQVVDVLWARTATAQTVGVPLVDFIAAHSRDGDPLEPQQTNTLALFDVGPSPIYIIRTLPQETAIPHITAIAPEEAANALATSVVITGSNFVEPPALALGTHRLSRAALRSSVSIQATVPPALPPGTYDVIVANPSGQTAALPNGFTLLSEDPEPHITEVRPDRGMTNVTTTLNIYGTDFADGTSIVLGTLPLTNLTRINGTHLRAELPATLLPDTYDITVANPNGKSVTLRDAYHAFDPISRDVAGYAYEFWTDPIVPQANVPVEIGVVVHDQGRSRRLEDADVRFYLGDPAADGMLLNDSAIQSRDTDDTTGTSTITWTPRASGVHTLTAVIDPDNAISERVKANNTVSRTLTVVAPGAAPSDIRLEDFSIDGGATSTSGPGVSLDVGAAQGSYERAFVLFVEYEYSLGTGQWLPIQQSGWMPHTAAQSYRWKLRGAPSMHYVQAWVADQTGQVSPLPSSALINRVLPRTEVAANQSQVYRYQLAAGERLTAQVESERGDADLYVWSMSEEASLWISNRSGDEDETISFVAPISGTYQIEVDALTAATYQLEVTVETDSSDTEDIQAIDVNKVLRPEPHLPLTSVPSQRFALPLVPVAFDVTQPPVYLPLLGQ